MQFLLWDCQVMTTYQETDGDPKLNSLEVMITTLVVLQASRTKPFSFKLMINSPKRELLDFNKVSPWCQNLRRPSNWMESQISTLTDIVIHGNIVESKTSINSVMPNSGSLMPQKATKENHQLPTQVVKSDHHKVDLTNSHSLLQK